MWPQRILAHRVPIAAAPRLFESTGLIALVAALLLGGASQRNAAPLAAVELLCLPTLIWGGWITARQWGGRRPLWPLLLLGAAILVPCFQLVPLPPDVWTRLPGRAGAVRVLRVAGLPPRPMPISLTREATLHALLALLPPAAVFLATLNLPRTARRTWARVIAVIALASVLLARLQMTGGAESPLAFYRHTDVASASGFFSNRDHLADFLSCAIPLALAAWAPSAETPPLGGRRPERLGRLMVISAMMAILIIGVAVTGSRAGVVLVVIALSGGLALGRGPRDSRTGLGFFVMAGMVIVAALALGRVPALARFADGDADMRFAAAPTVFAAAKAYWPVGSGIGSFIPIYQTVEPARLVDPTIFNHAHDDFLEAALEEGVAAVIILTGFLAWFWGRCRAVWLMAPAPGVNALARAGSLIVAMILLHSAVDYPLRTVAMTSVFAFACGLMVPEPEVRQRD